MMPQRDDTESGLQGSVSLMKVLITLFGLTSVGGTIWLAWFDDRRLCMTNDFAAVAGAAVLALLVTAFVEVNAHMKRAKAALAAMPRSPRRKPGGNGPTP